MKRSSKSMFEGLVALASICLLLPGVANVAPPSESDESRSGVSSDKALMGGASVVAGNAYTHFGFGFWQHNYAVVENKHGVKGFIKEHLYEDWTVFGIDLIRDTRYVIEVDCLDIEAATREAWIGGVVVESTTDFPPIGTRVVYYVDDNDGSDPLNPDIHGGIFTGVEWGEPDYTCYDRPAPWFPDPSQRGKITVR